MKVLGITTLALFFVFAFSGSSTAQETDTRVVDQVVAQVNDGVITLSRVNREIKSLVEQEVIAGKNREESEKIINEKRGELIANMINEELVLQRAKELKLEAEIEAAVNRQALEVMQNANIKTLDALYKEMEKQGVRPEEIRDGWRRRATQDIVVQQEVQRRAYWDPTASAVKAYYEKNKARFTKPETVSVSEMFLGYAGRDVNAVREKAKQLLVQLRGGADYTTIAAANSDPGQLTRGTGKAEKLNVEELPTIVKPSLLGVKVGGYSEPIEIDDLGVIILRVDARESASSESEFSENAVRSAIMQEKMPEAFKKFMAALREDSYIKLNDEFRPLVAPILFSEERSEKGSN